MGTSNTELRLPAKEFSLTFDTGICHCPDCYFFSWYVDILLLQLQHVNGGQKHVFHAVVYSCLMLRANINSIATIEYGFDRHAWEIDSERLDTAAFVCSVPIKMPICQLTDNGLDTLVYRHSLPHRRCFGKMFDSRLLPPNHWPFLRHGLGMGVLGRRLLHRHIYFRTRHHRFCNLHTVWLLLAKFHSKLRHGSNALHG